MKDVEGRKEDAAESRSGERLQAEMEERDEGRVRWLMATARPAMAALRYVHVSTGGNQDGAATGSEVPRTGEGNDTTSGDAVTTGGRRDGGDVV
ncbi:hypothetical protein PR003_g20370 [Phytophthora rubi]|uniref:Uncharacterized protein n=1 Tax=Phytophthora rubi TaxID=129364 RepID=A0A6A4DXA0_9STRA|nr:hypothetical protein PR003_g20370 [Phytophthora rubi]